MIRDNDYAKYLLVLIPWVIGALFLMSTARRYSDSASRQQTATGTIVSHEPANHNRYGYRFEAAGQPYTVSQTPRDREPKIGDLVKVYYDSADPTQNGRVHLSSEATL